MRGILSPMQETLRGVRSLLAATLAGLVWLVMAIPLRLVVIPGAWLVPRHRVALVSLHMKILLACTREVLRLGGARFRQEGGPLPTASPVAIVANHQAFLDIIQITLLCRPFVPAFVARTRYRRFAPHTSRCLHLLRSTLIDPDRNPLGAIKAIRRAAEANSHGLLIFPEGHRTRDGEVRPFQRPGIEALLRARRVPVYVIVSDGLWQAARFTDALFRLHRVDAWSAVYGPFEVPENKADIRDFVEALRQEIVRRLADHRSRDAAAGRATRPSAPSRQELSDREAAHLTGTAKQ